MSQKFKIFPNTAFQFCEEINHWSMNGLYAVPYPFPVLFYFTQKPRGVYCSQIGTLCKLAGILLQYNNMFFQRLYLVYFLLIHP